MLCESYLLLQSPTVFTNLQVVVKLQTEEELVTLARTAAQHDILSYIVRDAGRTQIEPGSKTVLALGPAPVQDLDKFTRHLKLL